MKKYDLVKRTAEIKYKDRKEIEEGCTAFDDSPEYIKTFDTLEEAKKELAKRKTDVSKFSYHGMTFYKVEEYVIEENEFEYEINGVVSKKNLGKIIGKCISVHGLSRTAELLDYIKSTGYKYSTLGAVTVSIDDVKVPPQKKEIIAKAQADVDNILKQYGRGLITDDERYRELIKIWEKLLMMLKMQ